MARKLSQTATVRWLGEPEPEPIIGLIIAVIEQARSDATGKVRACHPEEADRWRRDAQVFLAELKETNYV